MITKIKNIRIGSRDMSCLGHFLDCGKCVNYQKCFDNGQPNSPQELLWICTVCNKCDFIKPCVLLTALELSENHYVKIELIRYARIEQMKALMNPL